MILGMSKGFDFRYMMSFEDSYINFCFEIFKTFKKMKNTLITVLYVRINDLLHQLRSQGPSDF